MTGRVRTENNAKGETINNAKGRVKVSIAPKSKFVRSSPAALVAGAEPGRKPPVAKRRRGVRDWIMTTIEHRKSGS